MDALSFFGITLAFVALVGGNFLEGGELASLVNVPAALLVFGGTLGAGLLQMPIAGLRRAWFMLRWVFVPPQQGFREGVQRMVRWSTTAPMMPMVGA